MKLTNDTRGFLLQPFQNVRKRRLLAQLTPTLIERLRRSQLAFLCCPLGFHERFSSGLLITRVSDDHRQRVQREERTGYVTMMVRGLILVLAVHERISDGGFAR